MPVSSHASRRAPSAADSCESLAPPGMPQVPPLAVQTARCWSRISGSDPELRSAISSPAAPKRPQCRCPLSQRPHPLPSCSTGRVCLLGPALHPYVAHLEIQDLLQGRDRALDVG